MLILSHHLDAPPGGFSVVLVLIAGIVLPACGDQAAAPTEANGISHPVAQVVIAAEQPFGMRTSRKAEKCIGRRS